MIVFQITSSDFWWLLSIFLAVGLVGILGLDYSVAFPIKSLAGGLVFIFTFDFLWMGIAFLTGGWLVAGIGKLVVMKKKQNNGILGAYFLSFLFYKKISVFNFISRFTMAF